MTESNASEQAAPGWLANERVRLATDRILDAAGAIFAERGVVSARMQAIARRAGCSRATLYRYFDSVQSLRAAYIAREARRLVERVESQIVGRPRLDDVIVESLALAVDAVRGSPLLLAWFEEDAQGLTHALAGTSGVILSLAEALLERLRERADTSGVDFRSDVPPSELAEWLVRLTLSLLSYPGRSGRSPAELRQLLRRFVLPSVIADSAST